MQAGIAYDSEVGRAICAALTAILTGESYAASAEMARELGAFAGYEENRADMLRVIRNHRRAAYDVTGNATAIAISNLYYPHADRGFSASANNWGVQMGIDALGNELKEFWPDIHRRIPRRKKDTAAAASPAD